MRHWPSSLKARDARTMARPNLCDCLIADTPHFPSDHMDVEAIIEAHERARKLEQDEEPDDEQV